MNKYFNDELKLYESSRILNNIKYTYIYLSNSFPVLKENYLYNKYIGIIPPGYRIIFLDGNRDNFNLDNLFLVSQRVYQYLRANHLFSCNKELTKSFIYNTELRLKFIDSLNNLKLL